MNGQGLKTRATDRYRLKELRTSLKPFRLHWFSRLRSTNDHAAELRRRGELFAPAVVLTGHQTAGRGRGAHSWWSPAGCITVTFVLPIHDHHDAHQIPLIAGVAVRNAAAEICADDRIQLKWPNDLLFNNRKLAGLLCERSHKADLIGIGINVNLDPAQAPKDIRKRLTSLAEIAGYPLDMTQALATLARYLHAALSHRPQHPFSHLLRQYDEYHALRGKMVTVAVSPNEPVITGICEGLDSVGRLLLRSGGQLHRVISGQVR